MRLGNRRWELLLNSEERKRHARTFPLERDQPEITLRKLDETVWAVESTDVQGRPVRFSKARRWEPYDPNAPIARGHRFSTRPAALNAVDRGESDGMARRSVDEPMMGAAA